MSPTANVLQMFPNVLAASIFRKAVAGCSTKKIFLKFDKPHRKTPVLESRFSKIADKDIPTQLFCW